MLQYEKIDVSEGIEHFLLQMDVVLTQVSMH